MIDALWMAASGVSYWLSEQTIEVDYWIDRHPCDDQPWVADLHPHLPAQSDGSIAPS